MSNAPQAFPIRVTKDEGLEPGDEPGRSSQAEFVVHEPGTTSALDGPVIADARDIGAAAVFERTVDGNVLTFSFRAGHFVDDQTGSTWDILGRATTGPLAGKRLHPV